MKIEHLDVRKGPSICTSIFVQKNGKILLGLRTYPDGPLWTTPGGRCDVGESVGENIPRELLEETGLADLTIEHFIGIVPGAKRDDTLYVYAGTTEGEPRLMEPDKFCEWRWFDPHQVPKNFINPPALRRFQAYLNRR